MVQIAIIGGGIGGLTAALALRQCGFEPEVFEQAPALLDVGAAIAIWPNAMRVLTRLNLAEKILEQAGVMDEIRWLDQHGRLINRVSIKDQRYPAIALHRADLQHTLLTALPASSIHLDSELVVKQILGQYRVKEPRLQSLHGQAVMLLNAVPTRTIRHIPRARNARADELANEALDAEGTSPPAG